MLTYEQDALAAGAATVATSPVNLLGKAENRLLLHLSRPLKKESLSCSAWKTNHSGYLVGLTKTKCKLSQ